MKMLRKRKIGREGGTREKLRENHEKAP